MLVDLSTAFKDIPQVSLPRWEMLLKFAQDWKPRECLDLAFGHGTSTVCMASALSNGPFNDAHVTAIDVAESRNRTPNVEQLLARVKLESYVSVQYQRRSCNWAFIEMLERVPQPRFDLIHIDGPRTWSSMGLSALIGAQLINPGGWLVLNGLGFTFFSSPSHRHKKSTSRMPEQERMAMQVDKVCDLLVKSNPDFANFRRYRNTYFAQRIRPGLEPVIQLNRSTYESAVCKVLARAHVDPDFRFDLVWEKDIALGCLPRNEADALADVRFAECLDAVAIGGEYSSEDCTYRLIPPSWQSTNTRKQLQLLMGPTE